MNPTLNPGSRLAASIWCLESLSLRDGRPFEYLIDQLARLDLDGVDLLEYYLGFDPRPSVHHLRRVHKTIASHGLEFIACWFHVDVIAASYLYSVQKVVDDITEYLAACSVAGTTYVVVQNGNIVPGLSHEQMRSSLLQTYEKVIPIAEEHGVVLTIEASRPASVAPFKSPEAILSIVKEFDSPWLRISPDLEAWRIPRPGMPTSYVEIPGANRTEATPIEVFADCLPYTRRIEAKLFEFDENGEDPNFPVAELMGMMAANGSAFDVAIEYEGWLPSIHPERDPFEQTAKAVDLMRRYLPSTRPATAGAARDDRSQQA